MLVLVQTCDITCYIECSMRKKVGNYTFCTCAASSVLQPMVRLTSYTILHKLTELMAYISTRSTWTPHGSVPSSNTCCTHTVTTNAPFNSNMYNKSISTQQINLLRDSRLHEAFTSVKVSWPITDDYCSVPSTTIQLAVQSAHRQTIEVMYREFKWRSASEVGIFMVSWSYYPRLAGQKSNNSHY